MASISMRFSWRNVFMAIAVLIGALLVAGGLAFAYFSYKTNTNARNLEAMQAVLKAAQSKLYEKQSAGVFGGKTPAETIYLYYEFLESRDFPVLSTYFVPEKRAAELTRFDGVSETEILAFVEELHSAEAIAKKASPNATIYTVTSPVKLELKKMPNGIWEFEYIDRKLK